MPKIALVTDCGGGPFHKVQRWGGDGNCVEGLGACLGADIWQGNALPADALLDYDVVIVNGNSTLWWLPQYLRERRKKCVLLWEGPLEVWYEGDAASRLVLRSCLDAVDGVMVYGPGHAEMLQGLHPRIAWVGLPLPPLLAPRGGNPSGPWLNAPVALHRGLPGALLLARLGLPFVQFVLPQERDAYAAYLRGAKVEFRTPYNHNRFREGLGEFRAVLNWDSIATAGRYLLDCSSAGVPVITSRASAAAPFLPREWQVDPPPYGRAVLMDVIGNPETVRIEMPVLDILRPDRVRARWQEFVNPILEAAP